jgi:hypothetical protein
VDTVWMGDERITEARRSVCDYFLPYNFIKCITGGVFLVRKAKLGGMRAYLGASTPCWAG